MSNKYILPGIVVAALVVFAAAPAIAADSADLVRVLAAGAGVAAVGIDAMRADEVVRALVLRAASFAFLVCLIGAIACAILWPHGEFVARYGWAAMMSAWLLAWAALRVRLS